MSFQSPVVSPKSIALDILRWILVLPAAAAGALIFAYIFVQCAGFFTNFAKPEMDGWGFGQHWVLGPIYTVAQAVTSAAGFVLVGTQCAPDRRSVVSTVLATIWGIFLLAVYGIFWSAFFHDDPDARTWSAGIRMTLYFAAGMFAAVAAAASINGRERLRA
jgi:hypothetical protein